MVDGPGLFDVEAVGESNYRPALWRAVREESPGKRGYRVATLAVLLPEPGNAYDRNAVQVRVSGELVGYLSREDAIEYQPLVASTAQGKRVVACNALILGGFATDEDRAQLGVWLDLPDLGSDSPARASMPRTTGRSAAALRADAPGHGLYKGKHYTEYVDDVVSLKRHGALEQALQLLEGLLSAVEEESGAEGLGVAPWYYEQVAIICRKQRDFAGDVAVLERFAAQKHAPGMATPPLLERLAKARERLEKSSRNA